MKDKDLFKTSKLKKELTEFTKKAGPHFDNRKKRLKQKEINYLKYEMWKDE